MILAIVEVWYVGLRGSRNLPISNIELFVWEERSRTGATEDTGHLDELDGLLAGIHLEG